MQKNLTILVTAAALAFGLGACSHEKTVLDNPPGTYERSTTNTDAAGTTTKKKTSTTVSEDADGNKTAVVKSKTTQDPKGLFNKTTSSNTEVIEEK